MTQPGYDPFSFGQVRLGADTKPKSGSPAPEDSLFAPAPVATATDGRDTSWDPPPQFEEPIPPPAAREPSPAVVARAVAAPSREPTAAASHERTAAAPAEPMPRARVAPMPMRHEPPRAPGVTFVEAAAPIAALLVCESAAAWTWVSLDNPVLGALAALLGMGLAAFAWFAVRR